MEISCSPCVNNFRKPSLVHKTIIKMIVSTVFALMTIFLMCASGGQPNNNGHNREFTCGKRYYRTFYQDARNGVLFIGAMDRIIRVNLNNISQMDCKKDSLTLNPTIPATCVSKGKSEDFDCRNHIRVIQKMGDGSRLYICGTNAHHPKDWVINANLTPVPRQTFVPGIGDGTARCPYDPQDNSTAIWVETGNPDNLPGLYSGTNAEFTKADTVIFRTDLYNMTTGERKHSFKRTLKYDSKWLEKPNFVASFEIEEYVYFFFREPAVEYMNCGKNVYSRVARVCKRDTGGKNILVQNWATYLKSRLNCSIPGDYPFYFNEIQSVYKIPGDDSRFYAAFTTAGSGFTGSALCVFHISAIQDAFKGKFKEQSTSSSAWLPVLSSRVPEPRPGECVNDTQTLPDTVLNFIRSHPLMDESVAQENGKPAFYAPGLEFTHVVVEKVKVPLSRQPGDQYTIFYAGTREGKIYKIVQWMDAEGESQSETVDILEGTHPESIRAMDISAAHKSIYVSSDYRVRQIEVNQCKGRYNNCIRCVRDPHCGWDTKDSSCKPFSTGLLQGVGHSTGAVCDCRHCAPMKRVVANWGQSLHLHCAVRLPHEEIGLGGGSQSHTWHHSAWNHQRGEEDEVRINYGSGNYVRTVEQGLVLLSVNEADSGHWRLKYEGKGMSLTLCSYNVTVALSRCLTPAHAPDFQRVYADWCNEFQKYKNSMEDWQRKQERCGKRTPDQLGSSQHGHPNEILGSSNKYG